MKMHDTRVAQCIRSEILKNTCQQIYYVLINCQASAIDYYVSIPIVWCNKINQCNSINTVFANAIHFSYKYINIQEEFTTRHFHHAQWSTKDLKLRTNTQDPMASKNGR